MCVCINTVEYKKKKKKNTVEYNSSTKMEWNIATCSNVDEPKEYQYYVRKRRQILHDITYMWNLKI